MIPNDYKKNKLCVQGGFGLKGSPKDSKAHRKCGADRNIAYLIEAEWHIYASVT